MRIIFGWSVLNFDSERGGNNIVIDDLLIQEYNDDLFFIKYNIMALVVRLKSKFVTCL